jgi:Transcriptional regulator
MIYIEHVLNMKGEVMNKKEKQREERKIQLLQIALKQFITKGFYGTSTREISKIAGISSGLMFHYYPSKESLYEALVEIGCNKMSLPPFVDSPLDFFEEQATEALEMLNTSVFFAEMFVFMGNASYHAHEISTKAGELLKAHDIITQSIPLIIKGQENAEIRTGNPQALSIAFWSAIQGIAEEIALNPNKPIPKAEWIVDIIKKV